MISLLEYSINKVIEYNANDDLKSKIEKFRLISPAEMTRAWCERNVGCRFETAPRNYIFYNDDEPVVELFVSAVSRNYSTLSDWNHAIEQIDESLAKYERNLQYDKIIII